MPYRQPSLPQMSKRHQVSGKGPSRPKHCEAIVVDSITRQGLELSEPRVHLLAIAEHR